MTSFIEFRDYILLRGIISIRTFVFKMWQVRALSMALQYKNGPQQIAIKLSRSMDRGGLYVLTINSLSIRGRRLQQ